MGMEGESESESEGESEGEQEREKRPSCKTHPFLSFRITPQVMVIARQGNSNNNDAIDTAPTQGILLYA